MTYLFELPPNPSIAILGREERFPIGRIFCVGRNYADHVKEMGGVVDRDAPMYFTKSPSSFASSGLTLPYPQATENYHYEMELVMALGEEGQIFGYACGLDMTRRDLQAQMKAKGNPWDVAKNVENSAIIGAITPAKDFGEVNAQAITLSQNGLQKQSSTLDQMIWSIPEILADLAKFYHLRAGDLIFTGTPAGVGAVEIGDQIVGSITGLEDVVMTVGAPD